MTQLPQVLINVKGVDKAAEQSRAAGSGRKPPASSARRDASCCAPPAPSPWSA